METKLIKSNDFVKKVCEAIGEDYSAVTRLVIDSGPPFSPVTLYIERYGDERLLSVDWSELTVKIEEVEEE